MLVTDEDLRELIEREERKSGLRPDGEVDAVEIERRRFQITSIGALVFIGLFATTTMHVIDLGAQSMVVSPWVTLLITFVAGAFAAYALDKDRHLKRLMALGDRVLAVEKATAAHVLERAAYATDELALHDALDLERVVDTLCTRLLHGVDGIEATVMLLGPDGAVHPVGGRSSAARSQLRVPESIAHSVVASREPFLLPVDRMWVNGSSAARFGSVAVAPIGDDAGVVGVVAVAAAAGHAFGGEELDWITGYASRATRPILNARVYEGALLRAEYLGQRAVATITDELQLVSHAIDEVVTRLEDPELAAEERSLLLSGLRRTGERLDGMVMRARTAMIEVPTELDRLAVAPDLLD